MPRTRTYLWLSGGLFVILIVLTLSTFQGYGMTWDERAQHVYGEKVLSFYGSLFEDRSALTWGDLFYYGGFFEVVAVATARLLPFDPYDSRHLLTALFGIAGIGGAWRLARLLAGPRAAFLTAVLLATYPAYYGHSFINPKDIPFAALYMWSLYYLVRWIDALPSPSPKTGLKLGVTTGLAMGVRVGGLLPLCYLVLIQAAFLVAAYASRKRTWPDLARLTGRAAATTGLTFAVAYALMLTFWPYALSSPIRGPLATLAWFARERGTPSPPEYIPLYLLFKLPELVLVLTLLGAALAIGYLVRRRASIQLRTIAPYALLVFAISFPPAYAVATGAYVYDEIRHFLFIIPPLFCLAGITLHHTLQSIRHSRIALTCGTLLLALHLAAMTRLLIRLHPYEYTYYNSLIGGVHGAYRNGRDVEYWASSYREGVRRLEQYLRRRDGLEFESRRYPIQVGAGGWCATHYFPPNFVPVTEPAKADLYLAITRRGWREAPPPGREIFTIGRFGAPFLVAKSLDS